MIAKVATPDLVEASPRYMTSYRGELAGIHNMVCSLKKAGYSDRTVELWCDSESVLKSLNLRKPPMLADLSKAEGSLVMLTQKLLQEFADIKLCHARGHQDETMQIESLPLPARLNITCDTCAKLLMKGHVLSRVRTRPPEGTRVALYISNHFVTTNLNEQIQHAMYSEKMSTYLCDRFEWTHRQIECINWRAIEMAKKRLDKTRSNRISKIMHHWLPKGHQTARVTGIHSDGTCPCCGGAHEDQDHLFTCQHHVVKEARCEAASSIETHLIDQTFPPCRDDSLYECG